MPSYSSSSVVRPAAWVRDKHSRHSHSTSRTRSSRIHSHSSEARVHSSPPPVHSSAHISPRPIHSSVHSSVHISPRLARRSPPPLPPLYGQQNVTLDDLPALPESTAASPSPSPAPSVWQFEDRGPTPLSLSLSISSLKELETKHRSLQPTVEDDPSEPPTPKPTSKPEYILEEVYPTSVQKEAKPSPAPSQKEEKSPVQRRPDTSPTLDVTGEVPSTSKESKIQSTSNHKREISLVPKDKSGSKEPKPFVSQSIKGDKSPLQKEIKLVRGPSRKREKSPVKREAKRVSTLGRREEKAPPALEQDIPDRRNTRSAELPITPTESELPSRPLSSDFSQRVKFANQIDEIIPSYPYPLLGSPQFDPPSCPQSPSNQQLVTLADQTIAQYTQGFPQSPVLGYQPPPGSPSFIGPIPPPQIYGPAYTGPPFLPFRPPPPPYPMASPPPVQPPPMFQSPMGYPMYGGPPPGQYPFRPFPHPTMSPSMHATDSSLATSSELANSYEASTPRAGSIDIPPSLSGVEDDAAGLLERLQRAIPDLNVLLEKYRFTSNQLGVKETLSKRVSELEDLFNKKNSYCDDLRDEKERLSKERDQLGKERDQLERERDQLERDKNQLQNKTSEQASENSRLRMQFGNLEEKQEELIENISQMEKKQADLMSANEALEKDKLETETRLNGELELLKEEFEAFRVSAKESQEAAEKELEDLKQQHEASLKESQEAAEKELENLKQQHEASLKESQEAAEKGLEDLKQQHEVLLKEAQDQHEASLKEAKDQHEHQIEEMSTKFQEEKDTMQMDWSQQRESMENAWSAQKENMQAEFSAQLESKEADLIKQKTDALAELKATMETDFAGQKASMEANLTKQKDDALAQQKESLESQWSQKRQTLQDEHEQACKELEERVEAIKEEAIEKLEKGGEIWRKKMSELEHESEEERRRSKNLEHQITVLKSQHRKDKENLKRDYSKNRHKDNDELQKDLVAAKSKYKGELRRIADVFDDERKKLFQKIEALGDTADLKSKGDAYYIDIIQRLSRDIMNMSREHFQNLPITPPDEVLKKIPAGLPNFVENTQASRNLRCAYVQHLIWNILTYRIFQPFLFTLGFRFDNVNTFLQNISKEMHSKSYRREAVWRQQTLRAAYTASNSKQHVNVVAATIRDEIVNEIKHFADPGRLDSISQSVRSIVKISAEVWRYAKIERELITATMPAAEDESEQSNTLLEFVNALSETYNPPSPRDHSRKVILRLVPTITRESLHPDPTKEGKAENMTKDDDQKPCVFLPGVALFSDSPAVVARQKELELKISGPSDCHVGRESVEEGRTIFEPTPPSSPLKLRINSVMSQRPLSPLVSASQVKANDISSPRTSIATDIRQDQKSEHSQPSQQSMHSNKDKNKQPYAEDTTESVAATEEITRPKQLDKENNGEMGSNGSHSPTRIMEVRNMEGLLDNDVRKISGMGHEMRVLQKIAAN
ncbi:MAG: hypothetical protein M1834_005140 [Cirrosporium novae-zelandiae]|nr:MAG: hypothetical protein M1834_005140 [Cirrosporium novae-zelandiae]